jgi:hypothetical protein
MGRRGIPLLGVWLCLLGGCLPSHSINTTSWLQSWHPFQGPSGSKVVQLETYLVEAPAGDPYLNHELWALTDDQVLPLEQKAWLEDNGFRVGQVGTLTPTGLQTLLTSEKSCPNPRRIQTQVESPTRLSLGPIMAHCQFEILQEERKIPVRLDNAECTLVVVPTMTNDGRTRLKFTPEIRHGKTMVLPQPMERAAWVFQKQQPTESFPLLSWEITLATNEYLVVGGHYERPDTLGYQCFIRQEESRPKQRLLVIRASLPAPGGGADGRASDPDEETASHRAPPLAQQAAWTKIRGSKP